MEVEGFSIFDRVFSSIVRVFVVAIGGILSLAFGLEMNAPRYMVVNDISVPPELQDDGYTPQVIAAHILAEWQRIALVSDTQYKRANINADEVFGGGQVQLALPGVDMSVGSIVNYFRSRLGENSDQVGGNIVVSHSTDERCQTEVGCYTFFLTVRGPQGPRPVQITHSQDEIDALIREAARASIRYVDPYLLAQYYYRSPITAEPDRERLSLELIEVALNEPPVEDDAWALTLRGMWHNRAHRWEEAVEALDLALNRNPDLQGAYNSRCWAKAHIPNRADEAIVDCHEALRRMPDSFLTMDSLAYALEQNGQQDQALFTIRCALQAGGRHNSDVRETFDRLRAGRELGPAPTADECVIEHLIADTTAIDRPNEARGWLDWLRG